MYLTDPQLPRGSAIAPAMRGATSVALDTILHPRVALALWERPSLAGTAQLDLDTIDDLSFNLAPGDDPSDTLTAAGYRAPVAHDLAADIAMLAARHRRLTGSHASRVRLDVIETDACRRFHADYVTLRLLCTYVGAGTQWCWADAPEAIHDLAPGTVGLFKGRVLMEDPTILHRSPPIAATGEQRLLLVIDPA